MILSVEKPPYRAMRDKTMQTYRDSLTFSHINTENFSFEDVGLIVLVNFLDNNGLIIGIIVRFCCNLDLKRQYVTTFKEN